MSVGLQNDKGVETKDTLRQRPQIKKCLGLDKMGDPLAVRSVVGFNYLKRWNVFCLSLNVNFLVYYSS